jgi:hypothetical protein
MRWRRFTLKQIIKILKESNRMERRKSDPQAFLMPSMV